MFSGIVQQEAPVLEVLFREDLLRLGITLPLSYGEVVHIGSSLGVDGVCLTVVSKATTREGLLVRFDVMPVTLASTHLGELRPGDLVNVESALKWGDAVGGHLLSGHVMGKGTVVDIRQKGHDYQLEVECPEDWRLYLFPKGYIALNGVSLTIQSVEEGRKHTTLTVHLIPETLRTTNLKRLKAGDTVHVEIDAQTVAIVDTVRRLCLSDEGKAWTKR